jgi:hypothetical protein
MKHKRELGKTWDSRIGRDQSNQKTSGIKKKHLYWREHGHGGNGLGTSRDTRSLSGSDLKGSVITIERIKASKIWLCGHSFTTGNPM